MLIIWATVCLGLAAVVESVRASHFTHTWGWESQVSRSSPVWPGAGHLTYLNFRLSPVRQSQLYPPRAIAVRTTMCPGQHSNFITKKTQSIAPSLDVQEMSPSGQKQINDQVENEINKSNQSNYIHPVFWLIQDWHLDFVHKYWRNKNKKGKKPIFS